MGMLWGQREERKMSIDSLTLEQSVQRLFPNQGLDQVLVELLLERAQKNLVTHHSLISGRESEIVISLSV